MSTQKVCQVECMPNDANSEVPPESGEWRRPRSVLPYDSDAYVEENSISSMICGKGISTTCSAIRSWMRS